MLRINDQLSINLEEVQWQAVRAQGAGGQNVNKVSSAVHLRFDIPASSLPESVKQTLLSLSDKRISKDGVVVIKAQENRRQEQNKQAALQRLATLMREALVEREPRRPTRPTRSSVRKRLDSKARNARLKANRGRVQPD
ncbi:MAG: alternative ribosome rescue aminoacyl-tRNA hydrolase ArfB [Granulosicoccus sp.]